MRGGSWSRPAADFDRACRPGNGITERPDDPLDPLGHTHAKFEDAVIRGGLHDPNVVAIQLATGYRLTGVDHFALSSGRV